MVAAALLIDLDGTVWDSRPCFATAIAELSGVSTEKILRQLSSGSNVVQLAHENGVNDRRLVGSLSDENIPLIVYDGVYETLVYLRERGTPMGVVSNLPRWLVDQLFERTNLGSYFDSVSTPRRGVPSKPRPNGIRITLRELGLEANSDIWFVGDTTTDSEAADAAGIRFAWASYGYGPRQAPAKTAVEIRCFTQVRKL